MKTKILFFIIITILSFAVHSQSNDSTCPAPRNPSSPGGDYADENLSYSTGIYKMPGISNTLILLNGFYKEADSLLNGTFFEMPETAENLLKISHVLVIPSGGLFGRENDGTLKVVLKEYTNLGGTILCFASQYSEDYQVIPVPEGETLHAQGWRNSQSCIHGSIYYEKIHPIFAGQTSQRISAGVDGSFSTFPAGTEILIRRTANNEPALIAYPYGNNGGLVILSATYSDWSFSKGYCTTSELKLIRDLVTYCKSNLPIQMFNLELDPTPVINLNVRVRNVTEITAALAKLTAYDPDRTRVLYENQVSISLNPGEAVEVPIQFTLPQMNSSEMGIAHVYYELYDSENNLILSAGESDSGRFAIYRTPTPYVPKEQFQYWLTVDNEEVHWGDTVKFVLHARNYTDTERQVEFKYEWNHEGTRPLTTLTLPPGETVEYSFEKEAKGVMFWVYPSEANKIGKGFTTRGKGVGELSISLPGHVISRILM